MIGKVALYRRLVVWLLVIILAFPSVARSLHIYHYGAEEVVCDQHGHEASHHDCHDCPVCNYLFSLFSLSQENAGIIEKPVTLFSYPSYEEKEYGRTVFFLSFTCSSCCLILFSTCEYQKSGVFFWLYPTLFNRKGICVSESFRCCSCVHSFFL